MDFIDKLAAWMSGERRGELFSKEEWQILETMEEFEAVRKRGQAQDEVLGCAVDANAAFRSLEREKEVSFRLKSLFFTHMDRLLADGSMEGWMEGMAWCNLMEGKKLLEQFWEFYILKILIGVYAEEWKVCSQGGGDICMLRFCSVEDLFNGYFRALFLLRRREYGIEPQEEIVAEIVNRGLSMVYIDWVVENSQIREKEMVKGAVREMCGSYGIG